MKFFAPLGVSSRSRLLASAVALALAGWLGEPARGQLADASPVAGEQGYRQLAPGVLRTVDPERKASEDFSIHDIVELLAVDPTFSWAKRIRIPHQVWTLEFSYKPIRFIELDVPVPGGRIARKQLWYLVYRVRNPGPDPVAFRPLIWLEGKDIERTYPDDYLQIATAAIRLREDPNRVLLNTVEMAREVPSSADGVDRSLWGVAIWEDVDPRTDLFSVYIEGLTNAYRWRDDPQTGRTVQRKTLQLNFWDPGDAFHEHEEEIRPGWPGDVDYRWVYR